MTTIKINSTDTAGSTLVYDPTNSNYNDQSLLTNNNITPAGDYSDYKFYKHEITETTTFTFIDSEDGPGQNYGDNEKILALLTCPTGSIMKINGDIAIETNWDILSIYDGDSTSDDFFEGYTDVSDNNNPPLGTGTHNNIATLTSASNSVLFKFKSDGGVNMSGWTLTIEIEGGTTSSGAGGDPYIVTLDNRLYKMQNFQGYARMIQGKYDNKLFTINTFTKFSTRKEADVSNQYVESYFDKINNGLDEFKTGNYLNENEAFFDQIFIQWGNEKILVDMNCLKVIENQSSFSISDIKLNNGDTFKDLDLMDHYRTLEEVSVEIKMGKLSVILSNINNPQVKTAFRLNNGHLLKNINGAMANTLFYKDMKLKKITDTKPLERVTDRSAKKTQKEIYVNTENEKFYKDISVF